MVRSADPPGAGTMKYVPILDRGSQINRGRDYSVEIIMAILFIITLNFILKHQSLFYCTRYLVKCEYGNYYK